MTVIGLTGSSGSGKSTVAALLRKQGFPIIDCDRVAREVLRPDTPCLTCIFESFGDTVKQTDGVLNRRALADIVFHDAAALETLNSIMYPQITADIREILNEWEQRGERFAILDAPTLFESGADALCDYTVSVLSEDCLRIARIMTRDGITEEQARSRLASQQTNDFYRIRSDDIIENHGTPQELEQAVTALAGRLRDRF